MKKRNIKWKWNLFIKIPNRIRDTVKMSTASLNFFFVLWTESMYGYFYEILPQNLAQISGIYRLTYSFMAIWDGLQGFVSITGLKHFVYRYHIDMCLWYALRVSKGTLNPEKTNKQSYSNSKWLIKMSLPGYSISKVDILAGKIFFSNNSRLYLKGAQP